MPWNCLWTLLDFNFCPWFSDLFCGLCSWTFWASRGLSGRICCICWASPLIGLTTALPPLPVVWQDLATAILVVPADQAIGRAKVSGKQDSGLGQLWLEGFSSPNQFPTILQQNKKWCVLRAAQLASPQPTPFATPSHRGLKPGFTLQVLGWTIQNDCSRTECPRRFRSPARIQSSCLGVPCWRRCIGRVAVCLIDPRRMGGFFLAFHRGTFYQAVLSAMARRMQPARPAEAPPSDLLTRGVTATAYMEGFGGYGRCRDIGQIMWMVSMIMDHLQAENRGALQDAVALLMVCLEQTSLDNGRMDNWTSSCTPRRSAGRSVHQQVPGSLFQGKSLCTTGRAEVGCKRADLPEGRCNVQSLHQGRPRGSSRIQESPKKEGSAKVEAKGRRRGRRCLKPPVVKRLHASSLHDASFSLFRVLAAFPRWILATGTPFASFLAQTLRIQCCGQTPASVAFPLPLADFGLFSSSGPKLSRRRWICLLRKRMRYILVVALNFLHGGLTRQNLHLLGRRPNLDAFSALQLSCESSRVKLVGQANWNLADYLHDEFWKPFQEPRILHHHWPLDFEVGPEGVERGKPAPSSS